MVATRRPPGMVGKVQESETSLSKTLQNISALLKKYRSLTILCQLAIIVDGQPYFTCNFFHVSHQDILHAQH